MSPAAKGGKASAEIGAAPEEPKIQWEWKGEVTRAEMIASIESLPPLWGIKPIDYVEYVLPMTNNNPIKALQSDGRMVKTGRFEQVTKLYFQVAGRQAMLRNCVERLKWDVYEDEEILVEPNFVVVRMKLSITGPGAELQGWRWGLGKVKGGDESAWEKAETTARGRALGAWGFGVLPGSGLASHEEMQEVIDEPVRNGGRRRGREPEPEVSKEDLISDVLTKVEALRQIRNAGAEKEVTEEEAQIHIGGWIAQNMNVAVMKDGKLDLSAMAVGQLILLRNRYDGWIRDAENAIEGATS